MIPYHDHLMSVVLFYANIVALIIGADNNTLFCNQIPVLGIDLPSTFLIFLRREIKQLYQPAFPNSSREYTGGNASAIVFKQKGVKRRIERKLEMFFEQIKLGK